MQYLKEHHGYSGCDGTIRRGLVRAGFKRELVSRELSQVSYENVVRLRSATRFGIPPTSLFGFDEQPIFDERHERFCERATFFRLTLTSLQPWHKSEITRWEPPPHPPVLQVILEESSVGAQDGSNDQTPLAAPAPPAQQNDQRAPHRLSNAHSQAADANSSIDPSLDAPTGMSWVPALENSQPDPVGNASGQQQMSPRNPNGNQMRPVHLKSPHQASTPQQPLPAFQPPSQGASDLTTPSQAAHQLQSTSKQQAKPRKPRQQRATTATRNATSSLGPTNAKGPAGIRASTASMTVAPHGLQDQVTILQGEVARQQDLIAQLQRQLEAQARQSQEAPGQSQGHPGMMAESSSHLHRDPHTQAAPLPAFSAIGEDVQHASAPGPDPQSTAQNHAQEQQHGPNPGEDLQHLQVIERHLQDAAAAGQENSRAAETELGDGWV